MMIQYMKKKNGFKCIGRTDPSYFYFDKALTRIPRIKFQKHKLNSMFKDKLEGIDTMSEKTTTDKLGFFIVYDSGNFKFVWGE